MQALYHRGGVRACGRIAVYVRSFHPMTRPMPHDNVVKVDGTVPKFGELPICGSCRQPLWRMDDWTYEPDRILRAPDGRPLTVIGETIEREPMRAHTVAA